MIARAKNHLRAVKDRFRDPITPRMRAIIAHDTSRMLHEPLLASPDIEPTDLDLAITERLLRAYKQAKSAASEFRRPQDDIWTDIMKGQGSYLTVLDSGDVRRAAAYLCNMYRTDATHGTLQGRAQFDQLTNSPAYRRFMAIWMKDRIASFAEALGCVPIENPEQGLSGELLSLPAHGLIELIEGHLGYSLKTPQIDGGLFKLVSGDRIIHKRDVYGQYIAFMIANSGKGPIRHVCEIGGGIGRLAYWALKAGVEKYTIIDLPHINVLQSYYLMRSRPDLPVQLFDEPAEVEHRLRVAPYFARDLDSQSRFDLVVNIDSFPEIDSDIATEQLKWMSEVTSRLLSVNHESWRPGAGITVQRKLSSLAAQVPGFHLTSRDPFWLRKGYVTEWYDVRPPA